MGEKNLSYRALRRTLKSFGIEEEKQRGKGSERMFVGIGSPKPMAFRTAISTVGHIKAYRP
jgi:hypothetical protein